MQPGQRNNHARIIHFVDEGKGGRGGCVDGLKQAGRQEDEGGKGECECECECEWVWVAGSRAGRR